MLGVRSSGSGIAQIKVEGINAYKDAVEEGFPIVPAKAVIQEAKASGTAIDVTVADQSESGITGYNQLISRDPV